MRAISARLRRFVITAGLLALLPVAAAADPAAPARTSLPPVSARPPFGPKPAVLWYPGFAREAALREAWLRANAYEREYDWARAASLFEHLIARAPEEPHTYWRIARDYAWLAELAPPSDATARARFGNLAMAWADRGLQLDPRCGECCFYKYAGMGRVAIAHGILSSMSWLGQIASTLEHCMQIPPSFAHQPWDQELGNLYFAAATFYRMLPDSRMLELSVGVRGDPQRSLELARRAVSISNRRVDYNVGLAVALLCVGEDEGRDDFVAEGRSVLRRVPELEDLIPTDPIDRAAARRLLEQPEHACAYSRDDWFDARDRVAHAAE